MPPPACLAPAAAGLASGAATATKTSIWSSPISEGLQEPCLTNGTVLAPRQGGAKNRHLYLTLKKAQEPLAWGQSDGGQGKGQGGYSAATGSVSAPAIPVPTVPTGPTPSASGTQGLCAASSSPQRETVLLHLSVRRLRATRPSSRLKPQSTPGPFQTPDSPSFSPPASEDWRPVRGPGLCAEGVGGKFPQAPRNRNCPPVGARLSAHV